MVVATAAVTAVAKTLTSGIKLSETILKRKLPSEAKELKGLRLDLIGTMRQLSDEAHKIDPNDELIQTLYKKEDDLHAKINVLQELAISQFASINS